MLLAQTLNSVGRRLRQQGLPVSVSLWNGAEVCPESIPPKVGVAVHNSRALAALAKPRLGKLAKSYVEQDIDLIGHPRDIIRLGESLCGDNPGAGIREWPGFRNWRHSRLFDRKAISYHYDVSNDFYGLWLDRRRVYSCAYFKRPDDTLDAAQEQKLDHICRKLDLKRNERFLDIGCGWGGLVFWAAEHYGVRATGITLSRNQHDYVQEQIVARGLHGQVEVRLLDYRDLPDSEQYDKIASVGMFEHVGRKNLSRYFRKICGLLRPGGLVMNHGITAAIAGGNGLGSGISEFVDQYVFPGGELVHVSEVVGAMAGQGLECWDAECLRPHYAKTLWHWVDRLDASQQVARQLIGEKKFRIWRIYMAGSAHAFERGWLSLFQMLAAKPEDGGVVSYPLTRAHVYEG